MLPDRQQVVLRKRACLPACSAALAQEPRCNSRHGMRVAAVHTSWTADGDTSTMHRAQLSCSSSSSAAQPGTYMAMA